MEKTEEKVKRAEGKKRKQEKKGRVKRGKNLNKIYHFISQCTSMRLSMTCMKISFVTFMNDDENFGGIFFQIQKLSNRSVSLLIDTKNMIPSSPRQSNFMHNVWSLEGSSTIHITNSERKNNQCIFSCSTAQIISYLLEIQKIFSNSLLHTLKIS